MSELVIDADGHVMETEDAIWDHLPASMRDRVHVATTEYGTKLWMIDGRLIPKPFGRGRGGFGFLEAKLSERGLQDPLGFRNLPGRLEDLDRDGIDHQVVYPTLMLGVNHIEDRDLGVALAHAYNTWLAENCRASGGRIWGIAAVYLRETQEAVKELRRAADLGLIGVTIPGVIYERRIDEVDFLPFWATAAELNLPVAVHHVTGAYPSLGQDLFENFFATHVIAMPFGTMVGMLSIVQGALMDRFPALKCAFLEVGTAWVPYWVERMEEHWHMLQNPRVTATPELYQTRPRDFLRGGRWFVSTEPEEDDLPLSLDWIGEDQIVFASDYPHSDSSWPESVRIMRARADISETAKRKILSENALRLYPALGAAIGALATSR